jgi:hypothetical protein
MPNLSDNVTANRSSIKAPGTITAQQLCWGNSEEIAAVSSSGPFDLIVGTDVVFNQVSLLVVCDLCAALPLISTCTQDLVLPLLDTICQLSHKKTEVWLCLQERCPHAHRKLKAELPTFFDVSDMPLDNLPGLQFASELECILLRMVAKAGAHAMGAIARPIERTNTNGGKASALQKLVRTSKTGSRPPRYVLTPA